MVRLTARQAVPDDAAAISDMLFETDRVVLHIDMEDVRRALHRQCFYLVEDKSRLAGVCGLVIGPETVAQIRVFALQDGWSSEEVLSTLLPLVGPELARQGIRTLAYVGLEQWLLDGLAAAGFRRLNTIVTMQKTDFAVPDDGNPFVAVRPARQDDFPAILALDRAVFSPIWCNTEETLGEYLTQCQRFSIAELDGEIAGYQCLSLVGRHGHVTRVAVHPRYQGQRVAVRLLVEAIRFFQHRQVFGITLNTQRNNHRARHLYEWFGFKVLGKEAQAMVLDV
jgi:ribosomal protein S18 acetylase RimI-like enzyme